MADAIVASSSSIFTIINRSPLMKSCKIEDSLIPKVIIVNEFTEISSKLFYKDMSDAENTDQEIIPIIIDSYGGSVYSLLAMVDVIKSSKKKIATISLSKSMSCGAIMLTCGHEGYRFSSPTSRILIHDVSSFSMGKVEDLKTDVKNTEYLDTYVYKLMDTNCGHPEGYFKGIVHEKGHADWYITPEEAKTHNLINHIRIPKFLINVSAEVKFG